VLNAPESKVIIPGEMPAFNYAGRDALHRVVIAEPTRISGE
jgi:hypothetical protein